MCGIAGIADLSGRPVDRALLRAMTTVQAHRGPDGEGFVCRGGVGLGHRRLAIIDLVTGDQPMASDDGSVRIVFNGEIYNFRELRRELEARGAPIPHVIGHGGHPPRLRGRRPGLRAAAARHVRLRHPRRARPPPLPRPRPGRDQAARLLRWDGRRLLFASEIKGILEDPAVSRDLDLEALGQYLTFHYVPAPRTIFRAIRKLPPASTLVLSLDGGEPVVSRYWSLRFAPDARRDGARVDRAAARDS